MLAVKFYFNLSFLNFLLNVLTFIINIDETVTGIHHPSCVLITIPSPINAPKELPKMITLPGIIMNYRYLMAE